MTPKKDDVVSLSVGAGSAASLRFIKEQIISRFGNPILNEMEDGSFITLANQQYVVTTDTYVIDPPIFPGGDIGKLAISGTINDLVSSGASPVYLTLGLVIAEGFPIPDLNSILDSACRAAKESNVQIIAGDTKVLGKNAFSSVIINTTGIGIPLDAHRTYALANAQISDRILITGSLGDHGLAVLSFREGLGFEQRIQSDCAALDNLILPILSQFKSIHCLRDLTRGGMLNALSDLAEASHKDVILDIKSVPISIEVKMGCEMLGLDPLSLINEGKMLLVVSNDEANDLLSALRRTKLGKDSAIVGEVVESKSAFGELFLKYEHQLKIQKRLEGDLIPRLC